MDVKHKSETKAIVKNAVDAGKFDNDIADKLLAFGDDDDTVETIKSFVKAAPIKPDNLDGKIHRSLLPQLSMSYHQIKKSVPGGFTSLKEGAPEVYKAKFFEAHGRLPAETNGKPL
ncbi:MAG: hypothetical protein M3O71_02530 [Bacteroidota bacterium]|nr:hypothetical protein [Bacteroidota bacterium]